MLLRRSSADPSRLFHLSSSFLLITNLALARRAEEASDRMAESGQLLRPSPIDCSSLAGNSSGGMGDLAVGDSTRSTSSIDCFSACSLTTAAALRSTGCVAAAFRNSNCKRQRLSLIFDSHQVSSVPISVSRARSR